MFKKHDYVGWSDASIKDGNCYVAYGIKRAGESVFEYSEGYKVYDVENVTEAEYLALYMMIRKVAELKLKNCILYTDCLTIWEDVMRNEGYNFEYNKKDYRQLIKEMIEMNSCLKEVTLMWEIRKSNLAHPLFEGVSEWNTYTTEEIINKEFTKALNYQDFKQHIIEIPGTEYMILSAAYREYVFLCNYQKTDEFDYEHTNKTLLRNIQEGKLINGDEGSIIVKGKLHLYVYKGIIVRIVLQKGAYYEKWKEHKGASLNDKNLMKFGYKEIPHNIEMLEMPYGYSISKRSLMKLSKAKKLDFDNNREELEGVILKTIRKGKVEKGNGYSVYHYRDCHIQLQGKVISDLKIAS